MPTKIAFISGESVTVSAELEHVHGALSAESGGRVRFEMPPDKTPVYVNPGAVTHLLPIVARGRRGVQQRSGGETAMGGMRDKDL